MSARRTISARRALASCLFVLLWSAPLTGSAEGGAICRALEAEKQSVADAAPGADVYLGSGAQWLTEDLRKRYPSPPQPPDTAAGVRFQLQRVQLVVAASAVFETAAGKQLRARLLEELAIIDSALAKLDARKPVALEQLKGMYGLARLDQTTGASEVCNGKTYSTDSLFFQDASSTEQVVLRASSQESAGSPGFTIEVAGEQLSFVTIAEASEFRAALEAVRGLLTNPLLKSVERTSRRLTEINRSWSNYLEHGFSQYPWEAWINSAGPLSWDNAPWSQWIVLHPELSVIVDARHIKQSSGSAALLVHAIGFAAYGETRSWFVGLSLTGAVTTNKSWGLGAGGTLHFGHTQLYSRVPHISLAALVFANESGKLGPYIGLSADFWRLVSDSGEELFKNQLSQR